ncbi:MAG: hypothetical protein QF733_08405 [Phycisphaerales bacterium]|jgi:hypothetical protein|nr:hypothetical protein [Phycisphaerales bacterium]
MVFLIISPVLALGPAEHVFEPPTFDRWNYGFNTAPGTRGVGSTFSAFGSGYDFDDRDGQVLLGFETTGPVQPGLPAPSYDVASCTLEVMISSDDIPYDPTPDAWQTHLEGGPADADVGRPTMIFGAGFRNGWTAWSFGEDGPFGDPMSSGVRTCHAIDFDATGAARDVSNNLTLGFEPSFWATGVVDGVAAGDLIPPMSTVTFSLDVSDPDVQCYLRRSLADGLVDLVISSLHPASEPGTGGQANYPDWVLKENPLVDLGAASAASLRIQVDVVPPSGIGGDVTGDGMVDVEDLLAVLEGFGRCPCCRADLDESGVVDVNDLLAVIAGWDGNG